MIPAHPDPAVLSRVLREGPAGPDWPPGFAWYYYCEKTCAFGLATELWPEQLPEPAPGSTDARGRVLASYFGISVEAVYGVFFGCATRLGYVTLRDVTPSDVAAALDAALDAARG